MRKAILTVVAAGAVLLFAGTGHAAPPPPTPQQKCQQAKFKAQGDLQACLKRNAADLIVGRSDKSAECQAKFAAALQEADNKATAAGTACRYVDNGDGTVSDLNTGLVWEQKSPGGTDDVHDVNNLYSWSTSGTAPDGTAFTDFLGTLNNGVSTHGYATDPITGCFTNHCDWRLPSISELWGIVDRAAPGCLDYPYPPCIDPAFGPVQSWGIYWSATTYDAGDPGIALLVSFYVGTAYYDAKTSNDYVRAVRGGL